MSSADRPQPVYNFTLKSRHHVKLHLMSGVTVWPWARLLYKYGLKLDLMYVHRVLFLSCMAVVNTLLAIPDWLLYRNRIRSQSLHPEPVFILGNPRTGTTHLHNLLALDPALTFATTFQAGFPSSFITLEKVGARPLLQPLLSPTRPMDAMKLHWDLPAEDEIAVNTVTGGVSFYMPLVTPREEIALRPLLTLDKADPRDFKAWQDALLWFLKKVTFRDVLNNSKPGQAPMAPRPLLIKSPVHTARLGVWRKMFPQARYVYIHRHPIDVFRSSAHMIDTYFWYCYLQRPTDQQLTDYILDQYDIMYDEYMKHRGTVPAGRLFEVGFEDLEADPLSVIKRLYDMFGWSDRFNTLLPKFKAYLATLSDFKKNQFNRLSPELEERVRSRWAASFKQWGYS